MQLVRRVNVVVALAALVVTACARPAGPEPGGEAWIRVTGPRDWPPPGAMSLEFDGSAWSITPEGGGGVVSKELSERTEVRLIGLANCHVLARLEVAPGSAHIIRFAADGSVGMEDITGGDIELGPALVEAAPSGC
jgi:hypothetical protein